MLINSDEILPLSEEEKSKLAALQARIFYVPATKVALEVAGTELSTNVAMLGGLMAVSPNLVTTSAISESIAERFGGGKFVASATTAALDDVVKSKFGKLEHLVEKNMEIVDRGRQAVHEFLISRAASA